MSKQFRRRLKAILDARSMSLTALAKKTQVPKTTIFDWLAGSRPRDMDAVRRVCEELGTSINELFFGEQADAKTTRPKTEVKTESQCKRILIVEDDASIREGLRAVLESSGYMVSTAYDGQNALEVLNQIEPPCLILLDFMMPRMNGLAFAKEIRRNVTLAAIPIVVVTAYATEAQAVPRVKAMIKKPVDAELLLKFVRKYCEKCRLHFRESA